MRVEIAHDKELTIIIRHEDGTDYPLSDCAHCGRKGTVGKMICWTPRKGLSKLIELCKNCIQFKAVLKY